MLDVDAIQVRLAAKLQFHIFAFICLGLIYTRGAWNTYATLFLAGDTGSSCDVGIKKTHARHPNFNHSSLLVSNNEDEESEESSLLMATKCEVIVPSGNGTNVSMPCTYGWVYGSKYSSTQVSEWDLVCVRAYFTELPTTMYLVGAMCGALLITALADKFGRRPVMIICLLIQAVVGSCVAWSPNYGVFTFLRFIVGFFNMAASLCAFVMVTEIFPAQYRTIPCIGFHSFWACGIMFTAFFGSVFRHWQHLQIAISVPNVLCAILVWILPESLPWLISQRKISQAQNAISTICRFNCMNLPNDLLVSETLPLQLSDHEDRLNPEALNEQYVIEQPLLSDSDLASPKQKNSMDSSLSQTSIDQEEKGEDEIMNNVNPATNNSDRDASSPSTCEDGELYTGPAPRERSNLKNVLYLCLTSRVRLYTSILFYLFFVVNLSYIGISLSTPIIHSDQFLNLFFLGAVELPAYIICIIVSARVGRKIPLMMFMLVCGFLNIVAMLISEQASSGMSIARIVLVSGSKFAITCAYSIVYLYAAEIFPTPVRNHAMGISAFFENLGGIASPFIVFAAKSLLEMPMVLFGILCVGGSMMVFAMPETQRQPLPQTIAEAESMGMSKRRRHE